jgi:hypothetical protein
VLPICVTFNVFSAFLPMFAYLDGNGDAWKT